MSVSKFPTALTRFTDLNGLRVGLFLIGIGWLRYPSSDIVELFVSGTVISALDLKFLESFDSVPGEYSSFYWIWEVTIGITISATKGILVGDSARRCLMVNTDHNSKMSAAEAVRSKVNFLLPPYEFLSQESWAKLENTPAASPLKKVHQMTNSNEVILKSEEIEKSFKTNSNNCSRSKMTLELFCAIAGSQLSSRSWDMCVGRLLKM